MLSRPTTEQILLDCCRELMTNVLPSLTDATAQVSVIMVETVLRNTAVRAAHEVAWMRDETADIEAYAREVVAQAPGTTLETALAGPAVAVLPVTELGSPTWVPVVQSQPSWDRILLPTRPNRSTGWIYLGGGGLQTAYTPYQVDINLSDYRLTILDAGRSLGTWTVAEGAPGTRTPTGRTFVLASLVPLQPTYSPLILPLGTHSNTLTTFGGGPGTVGLHGWPDPAVFGHAISHGCVRVPSAALRALSRVPLGSSVMIIS
jgi:lipoprotein-anchoring transpeptidase ErfK/SrfK